MEQRPLRLGDTVDDYCPRERRITNHVIVAIVEDAIRQTRCSTCDVEHVYKEAREPRRRTKKDGATASDAAGGQLVAPRADEATSVSVEPPVAASDADTVVSRAPAPVEPVAPPVPVSLPVPAAAPVHDEAWPAHRRLIRASLPRVEGEPPPARPIPEFTMHQRQGRGGHGGHGGNSGHGARHGNGWEANGNTFNRHGSQRPGGGNRDQGPGGHRHGRPGQHPGKPGRHRGGKNKRSR